MSLSGNSSSQKSQSQQTSAPVVNQQGLDMLNANGQRANGIADSPFQIFTGQMTAPLSGNEQLAGYAAPGAFSAGQPALMGAQNAALGLSGYQAPQAQASLAGPTSINRGDIGNISGGDLLSGIQKYQNPYDTSVVNATLADNERARQMQRVNDQQSATAAHAFGGSRQGVADSLTNSEYNRNAINAAANLRQQGFNTAAGLAGNDAARQMQAAQANQGADLSVAGQNANMGYGNNQFNASAQNNMGQFNTNANLQGAGVQQAGAGLLGNIGGAQQSSFLNALNALQSTGATERGVQQSGLDAQYQEFLRMLNDPYQKQQLINQSLGLVPYSLGQESQGTSKGSGSSFGFGISAKPG